MSRADQVEANRQIAALFAAAEEGSVSQLEFLEEEGFTNFDAVNPSGETALFMAAYNGHDDFVRAMLSRGADVNKHTRIIVNSAPASGPISECKLAHLPPLYAAVEGAHVAVVRTLLKDARVDVQAPLLVISAIRTPAGLAIKGGSVLERMPGPIVKALSLVEKSKEHLEIAEIIIRHALEKFIESKTPATAAASAFFVSPDLAAAKALLQVLNGERDEASLDTTHASALAKGCLKDLHAHLKAFLEKRTLVISTASAVAGAGVR